MTRVLLVHWHESECAERAARLTKLGHDVGWHWRQDDGGALTRALRERPPDAVVIDLARLPSHGRAVATWLRERKALRHVPIVFLAGDVAKTERVRAAFPDAAITSWRAIRSALAKAIAAPPHDPVVPRAADYSGTPLLQKLGLKAGHVLGVVRAPHDWSDVRGDLPDGAVEKRGLTGPRDVVVLFCHALAQLRSDWPAADRCLGGGGCLWVAWPKRSSGRTTDLSDGVVRAFGLDQGRVDTKVCAIDATWSGLRFSLRRAARH